MKKIITCLVVATLSLGSVQAQMEPQPVHTSIPAPQSAESIQANALLNRLNEIKDMDKSDLSATEKKVLRKEVRAIKKSLASSNDGVYLSVGAIIIIVLLLILLL